MYDDNRFETGKNPYENAENAENTENTGKENGNETD